jgi:hypothetical protein
VKRGIKRTLLHTQDVAGNLLDTFRNSPAVERRKLQGSEDEQVQRALRKINGSRWHQVSLLLLQEVTAAVVEVQGDKKRRETGMPTALNFDRLQNGSSLPETAEEGVCIGNGAETKQLLRAVYHVHKSGNDSQDA